MKNILDPQYWLDEKDFGVAEILVLANHFKTPLSPAGFNAFKAIQERTTFRCYVKAYWSRAPAKRSSLGKSVSVQEAAISKPLPFGGNRYFHKWLQFLRRAYVQHTHTNLVRAKNKNAALNDGDASHYRDKRQMLGQERT